MTIAADKRRAKREAEGRAARERYFERLWAAGGYAMLHHASTIGGGRAHPDAGRIGMIVTSEPERFMVQFFADAGAGKSTFCVIPRNHWAPVPDFCVEPYDVPGRTRCAGWRLGKRGIALFDSMGWQRTPATEGAA